MLPKTKLFKMLTGLILAFSFAYSVQAEIYRWVDANGVVNYTQKRPSDISADLVTTPLAPPSARRLASRRPGPAETKTRELSPEQQKMLDSLKEKEEARQAEIARIKASNCERSRNIVDRLSQEGRIRVKDSAGEERNLPEDERSQRINQAQKGVAENCLS